MMQNEPRIRHIQADFSQKMESSATAFKAFVWPAIQPHLGGVMESVEDKADEETLARILDSCGIDAFVVQDVPSHRVFGIASRTMNPSYGGAIGGLLVMTGFSVRHSRTNKDGRKSTNVEYHKLKALIIDEPDAAFIRPMYTVQASFLNREAGEPPVYIALIKTAELIRFIHDNIGDIKKLRNRKYKGSEFYDIPSAVLVHCPSFKELKNFPKHLKISPYKIAGVESGYSVMTEEEAQAFEELANEQAKYQ